MDVPEGDVEGWGREACAGAGNEGWNVKESGLKEIGQGDERRMVSMHLKCKDSGEGWGLSEELILGGES